MDRLSTWRDRTRVTYVVLALMLAFAGWRLVPRPGGDADAVPEEPRPAVAARRTPLAAPPPVTVHVVGAVRHPGVYRLPDGARLQDAVRRAGGPARRADLAALNLAAPATDGQQVVVPLRGTSGRPGGAAPPGTSSAGPAEGPVSLSQASASELEALDGIGPTLAQRIVDWRDRNGPFGAVEDLLDVPGIGETRLEALRSSVVP